MATNPAPQITTAPTNVKPHAAQLASGSRGTDGESLFNTASQALVLVQNSLDSLGSKTAALLQNQFADPLTVVGDIIIENSAGEADRLPGNTSATREFLTSVGDGTHASVPKWGVLQTGDIPNTLPLTALGDMLYEDATPKPARLPGNITIARNFLRQVGTGTISAVPAWDILQLADIPAEAQPPTVQNIGLAPALRVVGGVYHNTGVTTRRVLVGLISSIGDFYSVFCDNSNPPTTQLIIFGNATGLPATCAFDVLPDSYYKIVVGGGTTTYEGWVETQ